MGNGLRAKNLKEQKKKYDELPKGLLGIMESDGRNSRRHLLLSKVIHVTIYM